MTLQPLPELFAADFFGTYYRVIQQYVSDGGQHIAGMLAMSQCVHVQRPPWRRGISGR